MSSLIAMGTATAIDLDPEPINQEWILDGKPTARSKVVARSADWASSIVVWDCTAGKFRWHYSQDEAIIVVSGAAYLLQEDGAERRFGPGDYGFFPAGSVATWRVDESIRKIALLREPLWRPIGLVLKILNKLFRKLGIATRSPLGAAS